MDDTEILAHIHELVEEEKRLRTDHRGEGLRSTDRQRLENLEEQLDQAWDLLRQRRARHEAGQDESETEQRSTDEVEHYLQ